MIAPKNGYEKGYEPDTWLTAIIVGVLVLIAGGSWTYALIQLLNVLKGG